MNPFEATDWAELAKKRQLDAADIIRLVTWNGECIGLGFDDGELSFDRHGFRLSPDLTHARSLSLQEPNTQVLILELEKDYRLNLPCTPAELLEWYDRVNETTYRLDENGGLCDKLADLVELPTAFIDALRPSSDKPKVGRPEALSKETRDRISAYVGSLSESTIAARHAAPNIARSRAFITAVFGADAKQVRDQCYAASYGAQFRKVRECVSAAIEARVRARNTDT